MVNRYGESFKNSILQQVFSRGNGSIVDIAKANNIRDTTIHYWLKCSKGTLKPKDEPSDRYKIICEYRSLNELEKGKFLRERGFFSTDIEKWEKDLMESLDKQKLNKMQDQKDHQALLDENTALKNELKIKNEALADLSAILILKKKVEALGLDWNFTEEDLDLLKKKKKS
jgi:DNA repair exonuclease SbcCD nuclease subunit